MFNKTFHLIYPWYYDHFIFSTMLNADLQLKRPPRAHFSEYGLENRGTLASILSAQYTILLPYSPNNRCVHAFLLSPTPPQTFRGSL